jgi:hypothetical protein
MGGQGRRRRGGDVDGGREVLDAAAGSWYEGHDGIRAFLEEGPMRERWRFLPTRASGQLAFGTYMWDEDKGVYIPAGLDALMLRGGLVAEVISFLDADFPVYGLPAELSG